MIRPIAAAPMFTITSASVRCKLASVKERDMKVVTIHTARDLRIEERDEPVLGDGQVEITVGAGGICGSDLHYYLHGGFGTVRLQEPMIVGHEVAGTVRAIGPGVTTVRVGSIVAINPGKACRQCDYCQRGLQNQCRDMRFYGSAMRFPHVQGAFRERLIVEEGQCVTLPEGISVQEATFAEPFAVALHAVARAGPLIDRSVLVTGSGPIGALVVLAARVHGAREIVATDVLDEPLAKAIAVGANRAINVAKDSRSMADYAKGKGSFDIVFEASGSEAGLRTGLTVLKARGILIQIGLGSEMNIPQNSIVSKEIDLRGSFRFNEEFALAAALIGTRRVDVKPLLTHLYPLARAVEAFDVAGDRTRAMKVQLIFPDGTA